MGSLFWEDEKNCVRGNEEVGRARRIWRKNNLDLSQTERIPMPTRYGRISSEKSRKSTYTMILSRYYLTKLGTALVVPFKENFLINKKTKIKEQIKRLAKVEGIQGNNQRVFAKCWGAISVWINPNSQYLDQLRNYWINNIINKIDSNGSDIHGYQGKHYSWNDGTLLDNNFQLQLPIISDLDFLLCTYISPKYENTDDADKECGNRAQNMRKDYPTAQMIGEAISNSKPPYVTYFAENRVNGIVTADDEEIFKFIPKTY